MALSNKHCTTYRPTSRNNMALETSHSPSVLGVPSEHQQQNQENPEQQDTQNKPLSSTTTKDSTGQNTGQEPSLHTISKESASSAQAHIPSVHEDFESYVSQTTRPQKQKNQEKPQLQGPESLESPYSAQKESVNRSLHVVPRGYWFCVNTSHSI